MTATDMLNAPELAHIRDQGARAQIVEAARRGTTIAGREAEVDAIRARMADAPRAPTNLAHEQSLRWGAAAKREGQASAATKGVPALSLSAPGGAPYTREGKAGAPATADEPGLLDKFTGFLGRTLDGINLQLPAFNLGGAGQVTTTTQQGGGLDGTAIALLGGAAVVVVVLLVWR